MPLANREKTGCVPARGPGLPTCWALWFKSHLRIVCGYKPCRLLGPRWNSAGKTWPGVPIAVTPPQ